MCSTLVCFIGIFELPFYNRISKRKKKWYGAPKGDNGDEKNMIGGKMTFHCSLIKGLNSPGKLPSLANLLRSLAK